MNACRVVFLLVLMLLSFDGRASRRESASPVFNVQVQVDAQGRVFDIKPMQTLKEPYAGIVQRTLATWRFHPAILAGKAVVTTTWLSVALESKTMPNGDVGIWVKYFGNGPWMEKLAPQYPSDMIRRRFQAKILLEATVGTNGRFSDVHVVDALTSYGTEAEPFVKSALEAFGKTRVHPIVVNGQPVASHIRLPITYSLDGGNPPSKRDGNIQRARDATRLISSHVAVPEDDEQPDDALIALDSPVTPVAAPAG